MKKQKLDIGPVLCMKNDRQAIDFILANITSGEPCSVVGMKDLSRNLIVSTLLEELKSKKFPYQVKEIHATSEEELQEFIESVKTISFPLLCVINLSIDKDVSWLTKSLEELRDKRSASFVSVVIADVGEVLKALKSKEKILVRSMFIATPADLEDSLRLIKNFEERFDFKLPSTQKEELYRLSGGQAGLLKSLFLLVKEDPEVQFDLKQLLLKDSILYRLQALIDDLREGETLSLSKLGESPEDKNFFEKFGFLKDKKIFSPLLAEFLKKLPKDSSKDIIPLLTKQEKLVFDLLNNSRNSLVSREDIAQLIWSDQWEDKYSDWAIDKLINRLSNKVSRVTPELQLQTKKGLGFILSSEY